MRRLPIPSDDELEIRMSELEFSTLYRSDILFRSLML